MNEISLFILDIVQNSFEAQAENVKISINEDRLNNKLIIEIIDDGCGIEEENLGKVVNPFYTTRTTRNVGLGLPLFKEMCENCNGSFEILSKKNKGTIVKGTMELNNIDRLPMGNIIETIFILIINDRNINIEYEHIVNEKNFYVNTKEIKEILKDVSIKQCDVMVWLKNYLIEGLQEIEEEI